MCAIAGYLNYHDVNSTLLKALNHRGPDDNGVFSDANLTLLHNRLAIQDIAHGQQPFSIDDFTIVFNGEIYNHLELREELSGVDFKTHSDTETLLHLYIKYQEKMLDMLDGMFAFAIYDKTKKKLFFARDRAGEKPLYIYSKENKLLFASELSAIANVQPLKSESKNISEYLRLGMFAYSKTPYENIVELKAAHYAYVDIENPIVTQERWWNIGTFYTKRSSLTCESATQRVDELLHLSVKRRIESSDLEVGAFLSGGIDSGLVTAIASQYTEGLKTFTVAFEGAYNEAPLAKLVADKYGTEHSEVTISFDNLKDDIEKIILNYGEPFFDSSAIPSYYVSQEAKKHLTVILNGDGADELFGGYRRYVPARYLNLFSKKRPLARFLNSYLPPAHQKKSIYNYFYRLNSMLAQDGIDAYLRSTVDIFEGFEENILGKNYLEEPENMLKNIANQDSLSAMMQMDFETILSGDLLVKMDIATMAHALESRTVFLSKELLEFAPTLEPKCKINGTTTKYILRELAKKYLPSELINQPKRGFEIPLKQWIDNELKDIIFERVSSPSAYWRNFITNGFIEKLMQRKIPVSDEKRAKILYNLFALEVWHAHFIKREIA